MKKIKKYVKIVLFLGIVAAIGYGVYMTKSETVEYQSPQEVKLSGVDEVKNREIFKKKMEIEAKRIYLTEEKQRITAEYEKQIASINTQLEGTRAEELSLQ